MFIHGSEDSFVPVEMVYELYEAATVGKRLLVVEGAGHISSSKVMGAAYWEEVFEFVDQFMRTKA